MSESTNANQQPTNPPTDNNQDVQIEAQNLQGIRNWVANNLGGEVSEIKRLERWRPQWKVSYTSNDKNQVVLFRGNRSIAGKQDLKFEMEVMQALEKMALEFHIFSGGAIHPKPL